MTERKNEFNPDYATSPGETLLDTINAVGMTQTELAQRAGKHKKTINEIIRDKASITPETAMQLEKILGVPASFWNNRQRSYDEVMARIEENYQLEDNIGWLKNFPISQMVKQGWIPDIKNKTDQVRNLLQFFGVASVEAYSNYWMQIMHPSYRMSEKFKVNEFALSAWLRKGEIDSVSLKCEPYDKKTFIEALHAIRGLTNDESRSFLPEMTEKCALSGVALVIVPELRGTILFGAARWYPKENNRALIQLSLRYKTDDQFWFTFFHEAKHILQENRRSIILDELMGESVQTSDSALDDLETDANRFASEMLIPSKELDDFAKFWEITEDDILEFAKEQGISPGIVIGQLQHRGKLPWNSKLNRLKKQVG